MVSKVTLSSSNILINFPAIYFLKNVVFLWKLLKYGTCTWYFGVNRKDIIMHIYVLQDFHRTNRINGYVRNTFSIFLDPNLAHLGFSEIFNSSLFVCPLNFHIFILRILCIFEWKKIKICSTLDNIE